MAYFLRELMAAYPENFISPKLWSKYKKTLEFYISQATNFSAIDRRNSYLSPHGVKGGQSPRHQLIQLLDASITQPFPNDLPDNCWHVMIDRPTLVRTTLEWSSSSHRSGLAKVYVTSRLLRIWSGSGINVNNEILSFAGSEINKSSFCKPSFYHVVSELTRSGHFSISRYLQWLIARGGVRGTSDLTEDGPCATRLLAELPTSGLPDSISRLRRTLLGRTSFSLDEELEQTREQIVIIENRFQSLTADTDPGIDLIDLSEPLDVANDRPKLSRAIKSEISTWLRKYVNLHTIKCVLPPMANWKDDNLGEVKSAITSSEFILVRHFLEDVEDLAILADVLKMVSSSDDIHVLAFAVDTLSFHIEAFAAIGALKDLFDGLLMRLSALRESQNTDCTPLLTSLADLAARLPGVEAVAFQLSQELVQNSRKPVADVCSPVSDHMVEALQSSESDFSDEIEKVLASGTFIDQSALERLFEMIVLRIEASWNKDTVQQRSCALLLGQLRNFNSKKSDALMTSWLQRLFQSSKRPEISYILGPLIALGCLRFKEVLASSVAILDSNITSSEPSGVAIEILTLLVGSSQKPNNMLPNDFYHLGVKRLQAQKDFPMESVSILRRAIESSVFLVENQRGILGTLCYSERMRSFLQRLILVDLDTIVQGLVMPLAKSSYPEVYDQLSALINYLLNHTSGIVTKSGVHNQTLASRIENAFQLADDLTLPFCQLELQYIFAAEVPDYSNDEKFGAKCLEAFERAVDSAVVSNNRAWMSIIPKLNVQIARHLCQRAERLFLQLVPSIKSEDPSALSSGENENLAERLLFIISAMRYSIQPNRTLHLASQVVEKLNDLWQIASQGGESSQFTVVKWLPLLLEFIILHISMFDSTKCGSDLRSRVLLSLSTLLLELHTRSDINNVLTQQTFDVALLLVDDLSEDARINCVRSLKDRTSDSAIRYIFGYSALPMDWLQLSQKGKLVLHPLRRWEILSEPTPNVGENDTSLSLTLFKSRRL
jgi:mediator of RNA polymerase II transcription subunit 12, fungi type